MSENFNPLSVSNLSLCLSASFSLFLFLCVIFSLLLLPPPHTMSLWGKTWYPCQLFPPSPPPSLSSFPSPNCCQPASAPNCHLLELSVEQSQRAVRCDARLCRLRSTACGKSAGWRRKIKRNLEQGSAAIGVCKRRGGRERESEEGGCRGGHQQLSA